MAELAWRGDPIGGATLHRRGQQVVVRRDTSTPFDRGQLERRQHVATLTGIDARVCAITELPAAVARDEDADDPAPISLLRRRIPPAPPVPRWSERHLVGTTPRRRPVTLLDDIDDVRSREFLIEAQRLVESGVFETTTEDDDEFDDQALAG